MLEQEIGVVIYTEEQIQDRVKELAKQIAENYYFLYMQNPEDFKLILVGVLKGCNPFMSDLSKEINRAFEKLHGGKFLCLFPEYISIESRDKKNKQKRPKWLLDTRMDLAGAHVLIVEDIIHSGVTLSHIASTLDPNGSRAKLGRPASLEVCALLDRISKDKRVRAKYVGFELNGDEWVVGYGMDSGEIGRLLPCIHALCQE
ncbi:hypoxanthine phosphoribosyltransferase [Patescibacteria group bacterium]|nr:hypoxanthine phosphoribosyltransferase [Patescibacteria group bacterium]MBU4023483.1 hypoxanthine phosphoribosyltransferase [Patescibacteria group bacterium]MBU4078412.1 hypoxanthine phosphoribosyltransferase [Patescibacteria group bacterium]